MAASAQSSSSSCGGELPLCSPYTPPATPPSPPLPVTPTATPTATPAATASMAASEPSPKQRQQAVLSCPLCPQAFSTPNEWIRHVEWVHSKEECQLCGKVLHGRQNATFHLQECYRDHREKFFPKRYSCPLCPPTPKKEFHYENGLVKHLHECHVRRSCGVCGAVMSTGLDPVDRMVRHIRHKHFPGTGTETQQYEYDIVTGLDEPPPTYHCLFCQRDAKTCVFESEMALRDHHRQNHDVFFCKACGDTVSGSLQFREHQKSKHPLTERTNNGQDLIDCSVKLSRKVAASPGSGGQEKSLLRGTVSTFPPTPPRVVAPVFPSPAQIPNMTQERRFSCPRCSYQATQKTNLLRHVEAFHITFRCRICQELQQSRKHIVEHVRKTHGSNADTRYDINDAHFDSDQVLWREIHRSPGEEGPEKQSHGCSTCPYITSSYSKLLNHQCSSSMTDRQRVLVCPYCRSPYLNGRDMVDHISEKHSALSKLSPLGKRASSPFDENQYEEKCLDEAGVFKVPRSTPSKRVRKKEPRQLVESSRSGSDTESIDEDLIEEELPMYRSSPLWVRDSGDVKSLLKREWAKFRLQGEAEAFILERECPPSQVKIWNDCFERAIAMALRGDLLIPGGLTEKPRTSFRSEDSSPVSTELLDRVYQEDLDAFVKKEENGCAPRRYIF